ncbi:MAG: hypothetical protein EAX86_05260 [Candidatus Heimdallarchaeota archaeon]|nr:hypothetical protein [Candidatus Heimdallarchaeota archaeon]
MTDQTDQPSNKLLQDILLELKKINTQLETIQLELQHETDRIEEQFPKLDIHSTPPSSLNILNIQEQRPGIFKTYKTIQKKDNWISATDVSQETGRSRGLESRYLNYLAENGFITKKRVRLSDEEKATAVVYKYIEVNE